MTAHAPVNLSKPWVDQWPDPQVRTRLTQSLVSVGMDVDTARGWMSSVLAADASPSEVVDVAEEWIDACLPADEALRWAELLCFTPREAADWHRRGFTPKEAELIQVVVAFNSGAGTSQGAAKEEAAWRTSGLPPRLVVLGVASGESLASMQGKVARGEMTQAVQGTLALVADMRGVDVQRLEVDWVGLAKARRDEMRQVRGQ